MENLEIRYGPVPVVRGLSLEVRPGEIVGVIGPNGAGKTTTLRAIMGVVPIYGGDVRLCGRSLRGRPPEAVAREGVALVPEGRRIYPAFTVAENLKLGFVARRDRVNAERDRRELLELFPVLAEFADRQAGHLSGGQQQQLAIARALASQPDVLLLDEPSLGLAPIVVDAVFDMLRVIARRDVAVLVVEQRAQRTVALADRTHVLTSGSVRMTLTPADAGDTERMVAAYFA